MRHSGKLAAAIPEAPASPASPPSVLAEPDVAPPALAPAFVVPALVAPALAPTFVAPAFVAPALAPAFVPAAATEPAELPLEPAESPPGRPLLPIRAAQPQQQTSPSSASRALGDLSLLVLGGVISVQRGLAGSVANRNGLAARALANSAGPDDAISAWSWSRECGLDPDPERLMQLAAALEAVGDDKWKRPNAERFRLAHFECCRCAPWQ